MGLSYKLWGHMPPEERQRYTAAAALLNTHTGILAPLKPEQEAQAQETIAQANLVRQQAYTYACTVLGTMVQQGATAQSLTSRPWQVEEPPNALQVGGTVQVGGRFRACNTNQIIVTQLAGRPCFEVFSVRSLLADMAQAQGGTLWEQGSVSSQEGQR
jgi:hypothetical protein